MEIIDGNGPDDMARMQEAMDAFSLGLRELRAGMEGAVRDLGSLERGFSQGLRRAFDGLMFEGRNLSDVLAGLGRSMAQTAYNAAMRPVTDHFGGLLAGAVSAVMPFAQGGVVSGPTMFPMQGGVGLMGEAGPEAIMPLARGADGRLGVQAQGGARPVNVTINVTTPDLQGFEQSRAQIAASVARAISLADRNR